MNTDVGQPIQFPEEARDEIFVVYYEGFIKNTSEGVVRTMLRDEDRWIDEYPLLTLYEKMNPDDLYENTMLMLPNELLFALSKEEKTWDEIQEDLYEIEPEVILDNSRITTFEFSLYQMLHEKNVKKCYIFKDSDFFTNEVTYIRRQYEDVIDKIEMVSGGFLTLLKELDATTIFLNDCDLVLNYLIDNFEEDKLDNMMFILRNSCQNINYDESDNLFLYKEEFSNKLKTLNEKEIFGVSSMFNFALDTAELEDQMAPEEETEDDDDEMSSLLNNNELGKDEY